MKTKSIIIILAIITLTLIVTACEDNDKGSSGSPATNAHDEVQTVTTDIAEPGSPATNAHDEVQTVTTNRSDTASVGSPATEAHGEVLILPSDIVTKPLEPIVVITPNQ